MKPAMLFVFLLISINVFASSPLKLQIMFEEGTSSKLKDELHQKIGPKLEFRGKNLAVDLVTFNKNVKSSEASKYCKEYKKADFVKICEQAVKLEKPPFCADLDGLSNAVTAPLTKAQCDVSPASTLTAPAGLHPLWSQMRIGSDLVRQEVAARKAAGATFPLVSLGNIDGGYGPVCG